MYVYDDYDQQLLNERVAQFKGQTERYLAGKIPEEEFLPHGLAGGTHDAMQPVLLTTGPAANEPQCEMCVDGAQISAEEVNALERVCILFDGTDEMAVQGARVQWKTLTDAGCAAQYWSEETGKWEKKAEK